MKCTRMVDGGRMNVVLDGKFLEETERFEYLESYVAMNGGTDEEVKFRIYEMKNVYREMIGMIKW